MSSEEGSPRGGRPRLTFADYDERHPRVFAQLAEMVHSVLPSVGVEHVGSTSVPGLGGRAVVDAVIPAGADEQEPLRAALLGAGFSDFPFAYVRPMLTTSVPLEGRDYPVLLYLLAPDHEYVRGWLAFREHMRRHPEEIERYADVKRAAIASGRTDSRGYQQAKTPYLEDLLRRITAGGAPEP